MYRFHRVTKLAAAGLFHEDGPGIVMAIVAGHPERDALRFFFVASADFGVRRSKARALCLIRGT